MLNVPNFTSKEVMLDIDNLREIQPVAHALSTELRLKIIRLISLQGMSVNEIARNLDVPVSTAALSVQILERAGLITCDNQPGSRGTMKICDRRIDRLVIDLAAKPETTTDVKVYDMPVGCYSAVGGIQPTCGLGAASGSLKMDDSPAAFYHPLHFTADMLWMREGYVEYHFPAAGLDAEELEYIEISFEACSEAPCYRNDWPSDIYVCVNGHRLGVWRCPGDFGGRRGILNPAWWVDANTQYGQLKTWRVNGRCTTLESQTISNVCLKDLELDQNDHVALRIGVDKVDGSAGGMNLFGKSFGDFPQNILLRCVARR